MIIGDIHGRNNWKKFADIDYLMKADPDAVGYGPFEPDFKKYIFLGDYCDAFDKTNDQILDNLLDIIKFKTLYPNNVILLWGNHDVQYYFNKPWLPMPKRILGGPYTIAAEVSGYRLDMHYDLYEVFNTNKKLFQMAFQFQNYLFSHAGVHFGWYHHTFVKQIKGKGWDDLSVAEQLNNALDDAVECIFYSDPYRSGWKKVGGPLWCGKPLIQKKPLKNTHQIVGHSPTDDIETHKINDTTSITFCDVLFNDKFYEIKII